MLKRFFIYKLLGFPDGPIVLETAKVPGMSHAYHVDPIRGYETFEEAETQLINQVEDEKLVGQYMIIPVYLAKERHHD